jgi:subtilisin family serine protease
MHPPQLAGAAPRWTGRLVLVLSFAFTILLVAAPLSDARRSTSGSATQTAVPVAHTVTLITGDVVHVLTRRDGRRSFSFEPGPDGTMPDAAITEVGEHAYVVPRAAMPLVAAKRLDLDLFDIAGLIRQGYDDANRTTVPVIVDYGRGAAAAGEARRAALVHARKTVTIAALGAAAFAADKGHARAFWRSVKAAGAARIDLDGRVRATVDPPVAQIRAPQAWAAGFDGSGSTVAVLDTGYDGTHPDLAGIVERSANFTTDASTTDGNGHGTHVASTIAGSGAGSAGLHGGVAPGARLLVGKVLADGGFSPACSGRSIRALTWST